MSWEAVRVTMNFAKGIAFDGCHKIYVLMDDDQYKQQASYGYGSDQGSYLLPVVDPETAYKIVERWFEDSCPLRFVNAVKSPGNNADFTSLIEQFEFDERDEEDDE